MTETTANIVKDIIIEQMGVSADKVSDDTDVVDLGCDSLDFVEIIMELEDEFDIIIKDEEFDGKSVVKDIIAFVEKKIADKTTG